MRADGIEWDQPDARWFVAWRNGRPVSAFRFETEEINRRRTYDDGLRYLVGMWCAWVPDGAKSKLITWPDGTPIEQIKTELIQFDIRLQ